MRARLVALLAVAAVVAAVVIIVTSGGGTHRGTHTIARRTQPVKPRPRPVRVTFTVEASGDLLIHSPVWERALELGGGTHYNFAPLFARVERYIRGADLPLCHVETPMTPATPTGYPVFNTPPELAEAIHQVGFRVCSTAATHSLDQGQTGIDDTVRYLNGAGVLNTGEFSSAAARDRPLIITVKGVKVAFLSYTDITNGIPSPHPWSVNRASAPLILADARRARAAGARVVIVNLHWGDENVTQPSGFQLQLANALTRSPDITAIVGQHVHVVQPIRMINGKIVVFGEGNLISNQTSACCPTAAQDGLIALLTVVVDAHGARVSIVHYVPIWVRHPDFVILPAADAAHDPADAAELRASYARTVAAVGRGPHLAPIPPAMS
jgi:poly-gamma-glutamate synthesis protein (capsule biosynthesis protein)